jgi:PAS domain S-box-containing protein
MRGMSHTQAEPHGPDAVSDRTWRLWFVRAIGGVTLGLAGYGLVDLAVFGAPVSWWRHAGLLLVALGLTSAVIGLLLRSCRKHLALLAEALEQRQQTAAMLEHHRRHTETIVAEKSAALDTINQQLLSEIQDHRRTEAALHASEDHYRALFENLQDVFYRTDRDGQIVLASPSIVQLLGYAQDEAITLNLRDDVFAHPEQWAEFLTFIEDNRYLDHYEVELKRCDGSLVWGSAKAQWYSDQHGTILGIEGMVRDISERKLTEAMVRQRTMQLETLRKIGLDLATHLDVESVLHSIVSYAVELSHGSGGGLYLYRPDRHVLEWAVAVAPNPIPLGDMLRKGEDAAGAVWATGRPLIVPDYQRWPGRCKRYEAYPFLATVHVPILWGDEFLGVLNVNGNGARAFTQADVDILSLFATQAAIAIRNARLYEKLQQELRERTQMEAELQHAKDLAVEAQQRAEAARQATEQALRAAECANQAKSEFLANMSHELRTPLHSILGYAQILQRSDGVSDEQREMAEIMARSGEHLLTMINHILDLSRIEAGKLEVITTHFALEGLIATVIDIARVQAEQKHLRLDYTLPDALRITVAGDETRLRQILLNLLGNAVKFTPEGQVTVHVAQVKGTSATVPGNASPLLIRFEITDTGIGIPRDQLHEIFEPFRQLKDTGLSTKGMGLGLAISRQLVRMMGSELHVKSGLNRGSTFWFDLLLPRVAAALTASPPPILNYDGPRRRILVADDAPDNRSVLRQMLTPLGFEVTEAADGREALGLAEAQAPDMIFMDLVMPVLDGFEAMRQLQAHPRCRQIPIVAVSANAFEEARQQSADAGCAAFLTKPVHLDDVVDILQRHLNLTWRYANGHGTRDRTALPPTTGPSAATRPLAPPSDAVLNELLAFVSKGDLLGIADYVKRRDLQSEQYAPFVEQVCSLARTFQIDALEHFLRQLVEVETQKRSGAGRPVGTHMGTHMGVATYERNAVE